MGDLREKDWRTLIRAERGLDMGMKINRAVGDCKEAGWKEENED